MASHIQRTVMFYGDELIAVQTHESGTIFVPLTRLCDNMGIERKRQAQRVRAHPVLAKGLQTISIDTVGGPQETQCLRIDLIPLWLAGVNANRVSETVRDKLIRYQTEVATVLWHAFKPDIMPISFDTPPSDLSGAAMAYEIATAIQHLARQQMEMEQRLSGRIDKMAHWARTTSMQLDAVDTRLSSLELQVSPANAISEQQAAEIALAVKTVGYALAAHTAKPGYGHVYGELYRRYGISSYKNVPQEQYIDVITWLHQWHAEILGEQDASENTPIASGERKLT